MPASSPRSNFQAMYSIEVFVEILYPDLRFECLGAFCTHCNRLRLNDPKAMIRPSLKKPKLHDNIQDHLRNLNHYKLVYNTSVKLRDLYRSKIKGFYL